MGFHVVSEGDEPPRAQSPRPLAERGGLLPRLFFRRLEFDSGIVHGRAACQRRTATGERDAAAGALLHQADRSSDPTGEAALNCSPNGEVVEV